MNICVTGGSGFIGRYFAEVLEPAGHALTILDLVEPDWDVGSTRFIRGDVRDAGAVAAALDGAEAVLHLAAAHHDFGIDHETYFDVNQHAATLLCDTMDERGIRKACFFSTVAVFGDSPEPNAETTMPRPNTPYGASKLEGERVFREWTEKGDGRRCFVVRPTMTFGPRNFANMYSLIRQVHDGKFFFVGEGSNIKSLSYVGNLVAATMFLWGRDDLPPYDVFNYVEKPDLTSRGIAETIYRSLGRAAPRWRVPMWTARLAALPFDVAIALTGRNIAVSGARVKKLFEAQTMYEADKIREIGFRPTVTLEEGIDRMVKWYVETGRRESCEWRQPPAEVVPLESASPRDDAVTQHC